MALVNCPECGKEISNKSLQCIHCGCPIRNKRNNKFVVFLSILLVLLTIALVFVGLFLHKNNFLRHYDTTSSNSDTNILDQSASQSSSCFDNSETSSTNKPTESLSSKPSELDYANFVCDYYNKHLTQFYLTYSIEKHAYQAHLDLSFTDTYRYLAGNDMLAATRVHNEVYNDLYRAFVKLCNQLSDQVEFDYGYAMTVELFAPNDEEILFVVKDGECTYCAYFNYVPES